MTPDEIKLWQTCGTCPEQYDAYVGELDFWDPYPQLDWSTEVPSNEPIAFLHLRHGFFFVECQGERVLSGYPEGDGIFDDEEREEWLDKAKQAIANYYTPRCE